MVVYTELRSLVDDKHSVAKYIDVRFWDIPKYLVSSFYIVCIGLQSAAEIWTPIISH